MDEMLILLCILLATIVVSQVVGRYRAKLFCQTIEKHNEAVQNMLVDLTERMRIYSEASSVESELWANLNDLLLETVTEYYNSAERPCEQILSEVCQYISQVNECLVKIASSDDETTLLLSYAKKIKSNKLSPQDALCKINKTYMDDPVSSRK